MRIASVLAVVLVVATARAGNRHEEGFFILHEDHHTWGEDEVGHNSIVPGTLETCPATCRQEDTRLLDHP